MSRRRAAALFGAAILAGAAVGLLVGLLVGDRAAAAPLPVTRPALTWPAVYRCGITWQPEDLDRADRCCDCPR